MNLRFLKFSILLFSFMVSSNLYAVQCIVGKDEMSFSFKKVSIATVLYHIATYSGKDLVIKTARIPEIEIYYQCVKWKAILKELESKYKYRIEITEDYIYLRD